MSTPAETLSTTAEYLRPIDKEGLEALGEKGKANPASVVTLKAKTICEGQFRMQTYVRDLEPMLIDEPPHLLGEDNAPNPSEALLATLGACLAVGVHANATARGVSLSKLELQLEGDINVTAVWGTGDLDEAKFLGFSFWVAKGRKVRRRVAPEAIDEAAPPPRPISIAGPPSTTSGVPAGKDFFST